MKAFYWEDLLFSLAAQAAGSLNKAASRRGIALALRKMKRKEER